MKCILALGAGLVLAGAAGAQEVPRFSFDIGGGFTQPVLTSGERLNTGWAVQGGAGVNATSRLGAMLQFNYNSWGINDGTLARIGAPDGDVSLWSLTINPKVHLNPSGPVDLYFIGGGGLYSRTQRFTEPGVAFFTGFDPFFGFFFPVAVPIDVVLAEHTVMKPGFNIGTGLSFGTPWKAKFYAEARYHRMLLKGTNTDFIPVTFGLRW